MKWLLIFVPLAILLEFIVPDRPMLIFAAAAISIVPLAALMAHSTGVLAERYGPGIGGLLNATFGNAAELIITLAALREGLYGMVKAALIGGIIGNILMVLGLSMLAGGIGRQSQRYNAVAASSQATMLTLAVIALIMPAAFRVVAPEDDASLESISLWISVVLIAVYVAYAVFSLVTNRSMFEDDGNSADEPHDSTPASPAHGASTSTRRAAITLGVATLAVVWMSELLVAGIEPTAQALGLSDAFAGVFLLAALGIAAEGATAVVMARGNRMGLSMSIVLGSSVQLALLVAPLLVLLSYVVGPQPMGLVFGGGLVISVLFSVLIVNGVARDGRSDWLRGVQLLAVYLILGSVFYFAPDTSG
ncbi:calcium/proton exchanger [Lysobacter sp. TY2-98]|uniref:calcium/proton exchanger n=1 Tax=Lysobacter sp. TY2-98 TaxID=2290922 RepID=UPI000E1FCB30|nr:calcium/proton exchanger [Lysobacter sp. TY2-98]AXK71790.1 calcium/proton exchanger [Lysobacter sp. TY2-98]